MKDPIVHMTDFRAIRYPLCHTNKKYETVFALCDDKKDVTCKRCLKILNADKIVLCSPEPLGLEGERTEKCGKCGITVYACEDSYPFKVVMYVCPICVRKLPNPKFDVGDDVVKRLGLSKKEAIELAKDGIKFEKYKKRGIAG